MSNDAIDLVAAAAALPSEHMRLAKLVLQLRDSHSIRTDLTLANDFISTMKAIGGKAASEDAGGHNENAFLALFYSALMLYVRATKTQHDHRRSFDFVKDFDNKERIQHKVICDLRDEALAHYGPGGTYNGPAFQKDGVFIPYGPNTNGNVMTASRRLVIQPQLIADLAAITHRALMLSERRTQQLNQKVVDEINAASKIDPLILDLLRQHTASLADFLGSEEAVADVMSGPQLGHMRGTSRH